MQSVRFFIVMFIGGVLTLGHLTSGQQAGMNMQQQQQQQQTNVMPYQGNYAGRPYGYPGTYPGMGMNQALNQGYGAYNNYQGRQLPGYGTYRGNGFVGNPNLYRDAPYVGNAVQQQQMQANQLARAQMQYNLMRQNQLQQNQMLQNQMKQNRLQQNQLQLNRMQQNQMQQNQMQQSQMQQNPMQQGQLQQNQMQQSQMQQNPMQQGQLQQSQMQQSQIQQSHLQPNQMQQNQMQQSKDITYSKQSPKPKYQSQGRSMVESRPLMSTDDKKSFTALKSSTDENFTGSGPGDLANNPATASDFIMDMDGTSTDDLVNSIKKSVASELSEFMGTSGVPPELAAAIGSGVESGIEQQVKAIEQQVAKL